MLDKESQFNIDGAIGNTRSVAMRATLESKGRSEFAPIPFQISCPAFRAHSKDGSKDRGKVSWCPSAMTRLERKSLLGTALHVPLAVLAADSEPVSR